MYAIRSYYDLSYRDKWQTQQRQMLALIDASDLEPALQAQLKTQLQSYQRDFLALVDAKRALGRITSYNVCYTKLLRFSCTASVRICHPSR